jgi:hypothetical protein
MWLNLKNDFKVTLIFVMKILNLHFFVFIKEEDVDHLLDQDQDLDLDYDQDQDLLVCRLLSIYLRLLVLLLLISLTTPLLWKSLN